MNIKSLFKDWSLSVRTIKAVCVSKSTQFVRHGETRSVVPSKLATIRKGEGLTFGL